MARYVKSECDRFTGELQEGVRLAKIRVMQEFEELEFENAQERIEFESFYNDLISELDSYSIKVGSYGFLSS